MCKRLGGIKVIARNVEALGPSLPWEAVITLGPGAVVGENGVTLVLGEQEPWRRGHAAEARVL